MDSARVRITGTAFTILTLIAFLGSTLVLRWTQAFIVHDVAYALLIVAIMVGLLTQMIARRLLESMIVQAIAHVTVLTAVAIFTAMLIVQWHAVDLSAPHMAALTGKNITVEGTVTEPPDRRPTNTRYVIAVENISRKNGAVGTAHGRVLVSDYGDWPRAKIGDRVLATGNLVRPEPIGNFRFDLDLAARDIYVVMQRGNMTILQSGSWKPRRFLKDIAVGIENLSNRIFPEPDASLINGLLIGTRGWIPQYVSDAYQTAGLTHLLAVSGFNVTLVLAFLHALFCCMTIRWRIPLLLTGVIAYTFIAGADPPVVRAAIMGVLGLLAIVAGRQTHAWLALLWTAAAMTAWNPLALWYDVSFHLSFLAIIGLMIFTRPITKVLKFMPDALGMRTALVATLAAQIATLPLMIASFRQLSLIAPLANMLIAPLAPVAMLGAAVSIFIGFFSMPCGRIVGSIVHGVLWVMTEIPQLLATIPYASISF